MGLSRFNVKIHSENYKLQGSPQDCVPYLWIKRSPFQSLTPDPEQTLKQETAVFQFVFFLFLQYFLFSWFVFSFIVSPSVFICALFMQTFSPASYPLPPFDVPLPSSILFPSLKVFSPSTVSLFFLLTLFWLFFLPSYLPSLLLLSEVSLPLDFSSRLSSVVPFMNTDYPCWSSKSIRPAE